MLVRILVTAALAAGLACAQGRGIGDMGGDEMGSGMGGGRGSRGMGNSGGEGMGGGMQRTTQRQSRQELFMEKLKLNKDQKEQAAAILSDAAQKARPVASQIQNGRQQIATAILQKKTDDEMKPLMEAYTAVCGQMTSIEADAFGKIYATLKPNQQKNAAQAFETMEGVFMPAPGVGRGAGRNMARTGRN
jgi:hypothetical protein